MNTVINIQCLHRENFLDGVLSDDERNRYEAHLAQCNDCREYIESWKFVENDYTRWAEHQTGYRPADPDRSEAAVFIGKVQERLSEEPKNTISSQKIPSKKIFGLLAAVAAVLIFGAFGGLYLTNYHRASQNSLAEKVDPVPPPPKSAERVKTTLRRISNDALSKKTVTATNGYILNTYSEDRVVASIAQDTVGLGRQSELFFQRVDKTNTSFRLTRGIAVFDVAPRTNGAHFVVEAKKLTITVIGTRFSVEVGNRDVSVIVAEGIVRLERPGEQLLLKEGFGVVVSPDRPLADTYSPSSKNQGQVIEELLSVDPNFRPADADIVVEEPQQKTQRNASGHLLKNRKKTKDVERWRKMIIEGKHDDADAQIQSYLRVAPNDGDALMLLATSFKKNGKYERAFQTYKKVASLSNTSLANQARYNAGDLAQSRLRRSDEAVELFESYLLHSSMRSPNRGEAKLRLSKALLHIGKRVQAQRILHEIIDEYRRSPLGNRARKLLVENP